MSDLDRRIDRLKEKMGMGYGKGDYGHGKKKGYDKGHGMDYDKGYGKDHGMDYGKGHGKDHSYKECPMKKKMDYSGDYGKMMDYPMGDMGMMNYCPMCGEKMMDDPEYGMMHKSSYQEGGGY